MLAGDYSTAAPLLYKSFKGVDVQCMHFVGGTIGKRARCKQDCLLDAGYSALRPFSNKPRGASNPRIGHGCRPQIGVWSLQSCKPRHEALRAPDLPLATPAHAAPRLLDSPVCTMGAPVCLHGSLDLILFNLTMAPLPCHRRCLESISRYNCLRLAFSATGTPSSEDLLWTCRTTKRESILCMILSGVRNSAQQCQTCSGAESPCLPSSSQHPRPCYECQAYCLSFYFKWTVDPLSKLSVYSSKQCLCGLCILSNPLYYILLFLKFLLFLFFASSSSRLIIHSLFVRCRAQSRKHSEIEYHLLSYLHFLFHLVWPFFVTSNFLQIITSRSRNHAFILQSLAFPWLVSRLRGCRALTQHPEERSVHSGAGQEPTL